MSWSKGLEGSNPSSPTKMVMGIQVEYNPDLALRAFGTPGRGTEECVPEMLVVGVTYGFLKRGQRLYWMHGELPLVTTDGSEHLSRPLASIVIREATHFLQNNETWTRGIYEVCAVFTDTDVHFEGFTRKDIFTIR